MSKVIEVQVKKEERLKEPPNRLYIQSAMSSQIRHLKLFSEDEGTLKVVNKTIKEKG